MNPKKDFSTGALSVIGVDIGKETFHIVGLGVERPPLGGPVGMLV